MTLSITPSIKAPTENPAPASQGSQPSSKLKKAAQEFESILLQSWLEKMNQSFVGASESQDAAHDTVSSLGTQAIASALAARGGIGIARMLLRQLQPADRSVRSPQQENFAAPKTGLEKGHSR
jgi:Rod binding domain-containing protein